MRTCQAKRRCTGVESWESVHGSWESSSLEPDSSWLVSLVAGRNLAAAMISGRPYTEEVGFCFFLCWASFFIGIFLFVIGIIPATYFPHKAPASEDAQGNAGELSHLGTAPVCPNQASFRLRHET